jgi:hypothetical protein
MIKVLLENWVTVEKDSVEAVGVDNREGISYGMWRSNLRVLGSKRPCELLISWLDNVGYSGSHEALDESLTAGDSLDQPHYYAFTTRCIDKAYRVNTQRVSLIKSRGE